MKKLNNKKTQFSHGKLLRLLEFWECANNRGDKSAKEKIEFIKEELKHTPITKDADSLTKLKHTINNL